MKQVNENRELIKISSLCVNYENTQALCTISMSIKSSDFIGVIGPNGGGKTTLVKSILKLIKPTSGSVEYVDSKLRIGYLPQQKGIDQLFPISVLDVVLSGLQGSNLMFRPNKAQRQLAKELLEQNGLKELHKRQIGELSGGQLQRVLLCRALISEPELLILDEPTTFVDKNFEQGFYELLKQLSNKMAIVIVSHDIGTICSYVRSIACVNKHLHYHPAAQITQEILSHYDCPIQLVTHGKVAHTVLSNHN